MFDLEDKMKTFCIRPWIELSVDEEGDIYPCNKIKCRKAQLGFRSQVNLNSERDIMTIINRQLWRLLRKNMLIGLEHSLCRECYFEERLTGFSERISFNRKYKDMIPEFLENTNANGKTKLNPRVIDIHFGNTCNLKCRMCGPNSSALLIDEISEYEELEWDQIKYWKKLSWHKDEKTLNKLKSLVPHLGQITLLGGEPMITRNVNNFLRYCVESGYAGNIDLIYVTNMTIHPEPFKELWRHFKSVLINCSIDGIGPVNEYIRYPSRWSTIEANMKLLDREFEDYNIYKMQVYYTLQVFNIFHVEEFTHYLQDNYHFINPVPQFNLLTYPEYLSCQILPENMKKKATLQLQHLLEDMKKKYPDNRDWIFSKIKNAIKFINERDQSHLINEFLKRTAFFDRKRDQNYRDVFPELLDLEKQYYYSGLIKSE